MTSPTDSRAGSDGGAGLTLWMSPAQLFSLLIVTSKDHYLEAIYSGVPIALEVYTEDGVVEEVYRMFPADVRAVHEQATEEEKAVAKGFLDEFARLAEEANISSLKHHGTGSSLIDEYYPILSGSDRGPS